MAENQHQVITTLAGEDVGITVDSKAVSGANTFPTHDFLLLSEIEELKKVMERVKDLLEIMIGID